MIIRDENGKAVRAEKLSDITKEISDIERIFDTAVKNKKNGGSMPEDEKEALKLRMEDLKTLISGVEDEIKKSASALEVINFVKALTKLKKFADAVSNGTDND